MARTSAVPEQLTDANISKVISLIEADSPITKKTACAMLGISYNVTRLDSLLNKFKEKERAFEERYSKKLGTAITADEIGTIVKEYLSDTPVTQIAKLLARPTGVVNSVLEQTGTPKREPGQNYWNPPVVPESSLKEDYKDGERCYSVRYQCLAIVRCSVPHKDGKVYSIWLEGDMQQFAYQPWWELSSLEHYKQYGVTI